jgi:RNA polymerase sigma-70 factor (ECF subfamily)
MGTQLEMLSRLVKSGTTRDFETVYQAELPRVYNFFRYRVGDDQIAEDLTAETFEKAWRNRQRYRDDLASFSTWLFTIARRVAMDHFRKRRPTVPLEEAAHVADPQILEEAAQQRSEFALLSRLFRLAERERVGGSQYGGTLPTAIARISRLSESMSARSMPRCSAVAGPIENEP